ncbi:centrin, EF-hand protein [Tritrichomonas musculus]|uniref:Centrin, EF-hand protein n=1 Tax=Tritrichomonas musculus TaxID=1915356 RepID=A0ABR2L7I5_9EUKA
MFDPDFFTDEQYQLIAKEFYNYAKMKQRPVLDQESMKKAILNLNLIPTPTPDELNAMCSSGHADLEKFFITIFLYLRGFGSKSQLISSLQLYGDEKTKTISISNLFKVLKESPYRLSDEQLSEIKKSLKAKSDNDRIDYIAFANKMLPK